MKATRKSLAAILIAGPLCLAACGDDSNAPLTPGQTSGNVQIPVDNAPPKTVAKADVQTTADGAVAAPVQVGTPLRNGGSHSQMNMQQGTKLYDAAGTPVTGGALSVELTSYNSNAAQGIQKFREDRAHARVGNMTPRGLGLDDFPHKVGALEVQLRVGTSVVTKVQSPDGARSGVSVKYCSPSLSVFATCQVAQQLNDNSYQVFNTSVGVSNMEGSFCVVFDLPTVLYATATRPAGILIAGNGGTGIGG